MVAAADSLQVPLVRLAAFENHFGGHEQECARVYRGTFSADNALKFSEEVSFRGLHDRILELRVEDIKITGEMLPTGSPVAHACCREVRSRLIEVHYWAVKFSLSI
jgi:hypothetical protein